MGLVPLTMAGLRILPAGGLATAASFVQPCGLLSARRMFDTTFFPLTLEGRQDRVHSVTSVCSVSYYGILLVLSRYGLNLFPSKLLNYPQFPFSTICFGSRL